MPDYPNSAALLTAASVIPGASLTRSKAPGRFFAVGGGPLFADSGDGAILIDADGNRFIDMLCALGAISLGYGQTWRFKGDAGLPISEGQLFSLPHPVEARAAHTVLDHVAPWANRCRFVKTGSEATHAAYRIAKAATGRNLVAIGDWAYHGWHEWCGDKAFPFTARFRNGHRFGEESLRLPFMPEGPPSSGDIDGDELAAVFVEPHRWEPTDRAWLQSVRDFCNRTGALMIMDEMIYGGRWALGGASEYFSIVPDLACFGKAIGNGAPIACVVGNDSLLDAHGQMVSGTYSGDTAALAAVVEVVGRYAHEPIIERLWKRGRQLRAGLRWVCAAHPGLSVVVEGAGDVHLRLHFGNSDHGKLFSAQMAARGVLWHPEVVNVCYSHTQGQIDHVIVAAGESMDALEAR